MSIVKEDVQNAAIEAIMNKLRLSERYIECYLSGAASKDALINYSNSLAADKRYWDSWHAGFAEPMWFAPLRLGTSFKRISGM